MFLSEVCDNRPGTDISALQPSTQQHSCGVMRVLRRDSLAVQAEDLHKKRLDALVFNIDQDRFRGITVDSTSVQWRDHEHFGMKLSASLHMWEDAGIRAVWVRIAIEHSILVPVVTELGFEFHHAQKDYVLLKKWLPDNEEDNTPNYAAQYLGCGGFVLNSQNQLLVVQEKYHTTPTWKLPGGHAEPGEEIAEATEREVWEETGVHCRFESVLCFRHQHQYKFGCSDFYFVSVCRPITEEIHKGANEIALCKWMDLDEYLTSPDVSDFNRYIGECYLEQRKPGAQAVRPVPALSFHRKKTHLVYSAKDLHEYIPDKDDILPATASSSDSDNDSHSTEV